MSILDFKQSDNARYGFTIAEILLTLAIVGTIAALGIPMLGQQKMKKPEQLKLTQKHGTFECYYSAGALHSYYADSVENPDGVIDQHLSGSACQFTPPVGAENFIVYAIGAGGTGAAGMNGQPYYTSDPVRKEGRIQTGPSFNYSLTNAIRECPWIKTYWERQWERGASPIKYTLKSPLGSGGYDDRKYIRRNYDDNGVLGEECVRNCTIIDPNRCNELCIRNIDAKGGYGGYGGELVASVKLRLYDDVVYETSSEHTKLQFNGNKYILLKSSENGGDGIIDDDLIVTHGLDGKGYDQFSSIQAVLNGGYAEKGNSSDMTLSSFANTTRREPYSYGAANKVRSIQAGTIEAEPSSIPYYSISTGINAYFGLAGTAGSTSMRVYEKLPSGTAFQLIPASGSYEPSEVKVMINNQWTRLLSASSGADGMAVPKTLSVDKYDSIFPREYRAVDFEEKFPAFSASHGVGYNSQLATMQELHPGKSGAGAYPVLNFVEAANCVYMIHDVNVGEGTVNEIDYPAPYLCFDGTEAISNGQGYYCGQGNSVGNPGAIVIKW